ASSNGSWYTGLRDTRACTQCQCGFGISKCTGGVIQAYSGAGCTGSVAPLGDGTQGNSCGALPFVPASARISGTPESTSCPPNAYPSGELTPTGEKTVCCGN
ncbi:MAG TPA: hypothetical protein VG937_18715, partial [Polyangiaceae bacterium]|nr:hypothetical protein [Polyangiaceae bacterium]